MRIDMSENEARRYERATVLVVPVEPQPKPEMTDVRVEYPHDDGRPVLTYRAFSEGGSARWGIAECPFRPGDVLTLVSPDPRSGLLGDDAWDETRECTVVSVTAKMLGQLTNDDAEACGFPWRAESDGPAVDFADDWTADHGEWQPEQWVYLIEKGATT